MLCFVKSNDKRRGKLYVFRRGKDGTSQAFTGEAFIKIKRASS